MLFIILAIMGLSVQLVARANGRYIEKLEICRGELRAMDVAIARHGHRIAKERESLTDAEAFYHAWLPEIHKCQDSDSLISTLLVDAYALNLVPMNKEVKQNETVEFQGRMGVKDRIEIAVAGRYDRLVRYLDLIRRNYPFLKFNQIEFSVNDVNVLMNVEISSCKFSIPEADLRDLDLVEDTQQQWTQVNEEEETP